MTTSIDQPMTVRVVPRRRRGGADDQALSSHRHTVPTTAAGPLRSLPLTEQIPDWVWRRPEVEALLLERDIAGVFLDLQGLGLTQRRIAARTGQSQSEISEVLAGRRIGQYDLLVRIAEGLNIPRGLLGLAYTTPQIHEVDTRSPMREVGP